MNTHCDFHYADDYLTALFFSNQQLSYWTSLLTIPLYNKFSK
ncbi:hypothetical protein SELR_26850 [Selenomonas ruminantium subsp. lactilytica TAM6421]|uniref:Uncharacterized protein n=1 Tax=Selenomonas ruminantium subsp. lactilytica (strain NBRC 103574 / TAM6421) TaxID=927704 RepID=I0GUF6_SELRL|nr:hypothetical protein SELR_26850 [Selenomonas ruminantium subsp. lactilytica TAM6421]